MNARTMYPVDRWCWWPVADLQVVGDNGIGCGRYAEHERIHPESKKPVWMCADHAAEFDEILEKVQTE